MIPIKTNGVINLILVVMSEYCMSIFMSFFHMSFNELILLLVFNGLYEIAFVYRKNEFLSKLILYLLCEIL